MTNLITPSLANQKPLLVKPLIYFHGHLVKTFSALPQKGAVLEVAKRIVFVIVAPLAYLVLGLLALVGTVGANLFPQYPEQAIRVKASKYEALLATINLSLQEAGLPLIALPPKPDILTVKYLNAIRKTYVKTLHELRKEPDDITYDKVRHDLYSRTSLKQVNENYLSMLGVTHEEGSTWENLNQACETMNEAPAFLTTSPVDRMAAACRDFFIRFNPLNTGNPPHRLNHIKVGDSHSFNILGMGSPTMQGWRIHPVQIDPIFIGYLRHLRVTGGKHLYVSNQNGQDLEQARNGKIMQLQKEYGDVFVAITCAKNSSFYYASSSVANFEETLFNNFFKDNIKTSGCFLPKRLRHSEPLQTWAKELISGIKSTLFPSKEILTAEERKLFIELFYSCLVLKIAFDEKITVMNFTCKDGIDRGMGSLAWLLALLFEFNGETETLKAEKTLAETFFMRAMHTRKRNLVKERYERVHGDMQLLKKCDPKGQFRKLLTRFLPEIQQIEVDPV